MDININHIAKLAKLSIPAEKIEKFEKEMTDIIKMVEKLPEIKPNDTLLDTENVMQLREDIVTPSSKREDMLMNAPQTAAGCILIPKVVD